MKKSIVIISNMSNKTFFFSTNHCQKHGLGDDYVPCTHTIPNLVTPRETLPSGLIKNVQDLITVFYDDMIEIPNPDQKMQPIY